MRRDSPWKSPLLRILLAVLSGMLLMAAGAILLAGLLLLGNVSEWLLSMAADVLWGFGAFCAGRCAGRRARRHGIRTGFYCGAVMCLVLLAVCVGMGAAVTARILIRCMILLPAGICGGIVGVNTKIKKPPY